MHIRTWQAWRRRTAAGGPVVAAEANAPRLLSTAAVINSRNAATCCYHVCPPFKPGRSLQQQPYLPSERFCAESAVRDEQNTAKRRACMATHAMHRVDEATW